MRTEKPEPLTRSPIDRISFAIGNRLGMLLHANDRQKDYLATFELIRAVIPSGDLAPAIGIIAHTRKPLSGERASGRALLNLLAGSYVLGSMPRCVFVMQSASDDVAEDRIVWTCCKNNDGELGDRSAWIRCNGLLNEAATRSP